MVDTVKNFDIIASMIAYRISIKAYIHIELESENKVSSMDCSSSSHATFSGLMYIFLSVQMAQCVVLVTELEALVFLLGKISLVRCIFSLLTHAGNK